MSADKLPRPRVRRWSPRTRLTLNLLLLGPLGLCSGLAAAFLMVCTYDTRQAHYGPLEIQGVDGTYRSISSNPADECVLFIEIPGEGRFSIREIPQEVLDRRFDRGTSDFDGTVCTGRGDIDGNYWYLSLRYREGNLVSFHGEPASFSRQRDGAYISLPMTYREFHEAWGKPNKVYRNRQRKRPSYH